MQKHCPLFSCRGDNKRLHSPGNNSERSNNLVVLQHRFQKHSDHFFMFLWQGGPGTCPGCIPPSLCWIISKRWIYSVSDRSGSWVGTGDFSEVDGGNLLCDRWEDLEEQLTDLAELVLWHRPVSQVGGELTWTAVSCCCFRVSVLAPEAVLLPVFWETVSAWAFFLLSLFHFFTKNFNLDTAMTALTAHLNLVKGREREAESCRSAGEG